LAPFIFFRPTLFHKKKLRPKIAPLIIRHSLITVRPEKLRKSWENGALITLILLPDLVKVRQFAVFWTL
jgi:hypothetical protein